MNNIGVYWIAIELTTLVSTFLVCFELGRESIEAAWKYIVIVSGGISLALLGIIFYYWGGSLVLGATYDLTWSALRHVAQQVDPTIGLTAFLLVFIGFGTKVGLAPMHTWLPDAHSEGPAPVSAMLSGALLEYGDGRYRSLHSSERCGAPGTSSPRRGGGDRCAVAFRRSSIHHETDGDQALDGLLQR